MHCAHAIDNGSYSGWTGDVANYFVKYTQNAAPAQTLKDKFAVLEAKKDRQIETVLYVQQSSSSEVDTAEKFHALFLFFFHKPQEFLVILAQKATTVFASAFNPHLMVRN